MTTPPPDKYAKKAHDIVSNWALAQGYTEVTAELLDLVTDVAEAIRAVADESKPWPWGPDGENL